VSAHGLRPHHYSGPDRSTAIGSGGKGDGPLAGRRGGACTWPVGRGRGGEDRLGHGLWGEETKGG
jgi:hypothetical protein